MDKKLFASLLGKQVPAVAIDDSARPKDLAGSFLMNVSGGLYVDDGDNGGGGGGGGGFGDYSGFIQSTFDSFGENGGFINTFAQGSGVG